MNVIACLPGVTPVKPASFATIPTTSVTGYLFTKLTGDNLQMSEMGEFSPIVQFAMDTHLSGTDGATAAGTAAGALGDDPTALGNAGTAATAANNDDGVKAA